MRAVPLGLKSFVIVLRQHNMIVSLDNVMIIRYITSRLAWDYLSLKLVLLATAHAPIDRKCKRWNAIQISRPWGISHVFSDTFLNDVCCIHRLHADSKKLISQVLKPCPNKCNLIEISDQSPLLADYLMRQMRRCIMFATAYTQSNYKHEHVPTVGTYKEG